MPTQRIVTAIGSTVGLLILVVGLGTAPWRDVQAQSSWRGLVVAPERRCSPYEAGRVPVPAVRDLNGEVVKGAGGVVLRSVEPSCPSKAGSRTSSSGESEIVHVYVQLPVVDPVRHMSGG